MLVPPSFSITFRRLYFALVSASFKSLIVRHIVAGRWLADCEWLPPIVQSIVCPCLQCDLSELSWISTRYDRILSYWVESRRVLSYCIAWRCVVYGVASFSSSIATEPNETLRVSWNWAGSQSLGGLKNAGAEGLLLAALVQFPFTQSWFQLKRANQVKCSLVVTEKWENYRFAEI